MDTAMLHERLHVQHAMAIRQAEEAIAKENLIASKGYDFLGTGLKDKGTTIAEGKKRVSAEMTTQFGADVTQIPNDEVLVYSEAFKELYKSDKAAAMEQLWGILGDDKGEANSFASASIGARAQGVENIVGTASTLVELKELKASFEKAFKKDPREQPVTRLVDGKATFYSEVTKALDAKIASLTAAAKPSVPRQR
jgi:hypothetical protein